EAAKIAVLDQIVRMTVMPLVADVNTDVVQERAVLQPLAFLFGEAVHAARLIEDAERQPGHLLCVVRPVATPLAELDDASASDIRISLRFSDARAVAVNVVEDQALAEREIAEREFVRAETLNDRIEQDSAGDREIRAPRVHRGHPQPALDVGLDD